jgi:clan AA aspartic protease (TIGR02281 family)
MIGTRTIQSTRGERNRWSGRWATAGIGGTLGLVMIAVLVAGCATSAQPQYQAAVGDTRSEECRTLQAVDEARQRYGISASRPEREEGIRQRCSLLRSGGNGLPEQTPKIVAETENVQIEKIGNTYRVPVRLNHTITLPFVLDTGATDLVIPADVALTLIRAGALTQSDFIGKRRYSLANGSEEVGDRVIIREVQVGRHSVGNVTAIVNPPASDLLLGQSFLSKFGTVMLDYNRLVLVLSP